MTGSHRQECASRDLAVGWALHALEPDEEARFAAHLPRCSDCTDRVGATEDMAAVLAVGVEQVDPPSRLRDAVLAAARTPQTPRRVVEPVVVAPAPPAPVHAVATEATVVPVDELRRARDARAPRGRRVLVAAAATVALAFGAGWVGSSLLPAGSTTSTAAAAERSTSLTEAGTSSVYAVVLSGATGTSVVPVDMPAPVAGRSLYLWGTGSGRPVLLGQVTAAAGTATKVGTGSHDAQAFSGYAISSEPAGATPRSPSVVVASSTA